MTVGYDRPRPGLANYVRFLEQVSRRVGALKKTGLGITLYGSYVRGDFIIGESDIDNVLVFPSNVVTDKALFREVSDRLAVAANETDFPMDELFQVCPIDVGIARDRRFNSLTEEFEDYFRLERRVLFGKDYTLQFSYDGMKPGDMSAISHNLRKTRQSLLFSSYTRLRDMPAFVKGFRSTLKAASRASKQILHLADGNLRRSRFSALGEMQRFFPDVDVEPLRTMQKLYTNPSQLDIVYQHPREMAEYWDRFMTFFEQVVKAYIEKFPRD